MLLNETDRIPPGRLNLDVAVEMFFGPIYYRRLLQTQPLDRAYADALTAMAARALS